MTKSNTGRRMRKSNFTYTIDGNVLFIEDSNLGGMSVTNDIENVIEEIERELRPAPISINELDVIYRDSQGSIDGIKIKDGKFHDFYYIGESDYQSAKQKIRK
jgi:exopolysaccharide biosynthesis protein